MNHLQALTESASLMQTLKNKVRLLISQSFVNSLEISQLKQENARLMARLREQSTPTANRLDT